MVRLTDHLHRTIVVDWDVNQQNKQRKAHFELFRSNTVFHCVPRKHNVGHTGVMYSHLVNENKTKFLFIHYNSQHFTITQL